MANIDRLLDYINQLNQLPQASTSSARLTDEDTTIIQDAISATICAYDSTEQAIYQPDLFFITRINHCPLLLVFLP